MATLTDSTDTEPNVTTILQEMMLQLQLITKQLSGMQRSEDESAGDDNFEKVDSTLREKEEAWETAVDTLKKREQRTTDSWKDELNNILIFSGLFSAIATAFTIVSITWLQQDPGDATNIFLAHFSLQFSNFVVTSNNINSSTPALPLQNVTSSFVSASYAQPVNILWVLSLTFSLIAAFFAITVQQWLRQLQIPTGVSLQQAASLLSLRYDGLIMWQVPGIIGLLPLLLQAAVVLFLVGLFILFLALNHTVAIIFGAVAVTALTVFLIMNVLPLVLIRCPYKSPLIPTIVLITQGLVLIMAGIVINFLPVITLSLIPLGAVVMLITAFILFIVFIVRPYLRHEPIDLSKERFEALSYRFQQILDRFLVWFTTYVFIMNIGDFWVLRECRHFSNLDAYEIARFDAASLIDVMLLIPSSSFTKVARCLQDIHVSWASTVFLKVLQRGITGIDPKSQEDLLLRDGEWQLLRTELKVWDVRKVPSVTKWFTVRHLRLGWTVLQKHLVGDGIPSKGSSGALIMFNDLTKVVKPEALNLSIAQPILGVCAHQNFESQDWEERKYGSYPVRLLLDVLQEDDAASKIDIDDAIALATKCRDLNKRRGRNEIDTGAALRLHLSYNSCALALMVIQPSVFDTVGPEVIQSLADLLETTATLDTLARKLPKQYRRPESVNSYKALPPMIISLCKSLTQLADVHTEAVLRNPSDSHAVRLAGALREVTDKLHKDDKTVAIGHLDWFEGIRACRAAELSRLAHALVGSFPEADGPLVIVTAEDEPGGSFDEVIQIAASSALVQFFPFGMALPPQVAPGNNIGTSTGSFLATPISNVDDDTRPRESPPGPPPATLPGSSAVAHQELSRPILSEESSSESVKDTYKSSRIPGTPRPHLQPARAVLTRSHSSSKSMVPCDAQVPMMDLLPTLAVLPSGAADALSLLSSDGQDSVIDIRADTGRSDRDLSTGADDDALLELVSSGAEDGMPATLAVSMTGSAAGRALGLAEGAGSGSALVVSVDGPIPLPASIPSLEEIPGAAVAPMPGRLSTTAPFRLHLANASAAQSHEQRDDIPYIAGD